MRTLILFFIALVLGLIIQATTFHGFFPDVVCPDLILILIFYVGLRFPNAGGAVGAFVLGLCADFSSAIFVGPNAAGAVVAFSLVASLSGHVYAERGPAAVMLCFIASLAKSVTYAIFLAVYSSVVDDYSHIAKIAALEALATAIVAPIVFRLLRLGRESSLLRPITAADSYRRGG